MLPGSCRLSLAGKPDLITLYDIRSLGTTRWGPVFAFLAPGAGEQRGPPPIPYLGGIPGLYMSRGAGARRE